MDRVSSLGGSTVLLRFDISISRGVRKTWVSAPKEKSGSFLHRLAGDASPLGKVGLKKGGVACAVGGDNRVISRAFLLY